VLLLASGTGAQNQRQGHRSVGFLKPKWVRRLLWREWRTGARSSARLNENVNGFNITEQWPRGLASS
jgi:hypothetical protein